MPALISFLFLLFPFVFAPNILDAAPDTSMFRGGPSHPGTVQETAPSRLHLHWVFDSASDSGTPREPIFSSPVVADGTVYVGSSDNHLYALDAATGKKKWQFKTNGGPFQSGGNISSTPAAANGLVYFMCNDGNFYAVNASDGKLRWSFATRGERRFTAPGVNYLQPSTETMPDPWDFFLSSPAVTDGSVYFGCGDGCIYSLDAASGALHWKYQTGDVVHATPALADGIV